MRKTVFMSGQVAQEYEKPSSLFKAKSEVYKNASNSKANLIDVSKTNYPKRYIDYSWLKSSAKVYNISPDIKDYIVASVPIVTSDIPNRNTQAFSASDLLSFDNLSGRMLYQTFIGKPTFINHNNQVLTEAKGVLLDASMTSIKRYKVAKVIVLAAFDRTKDTDLIKLILKGSNSYSMGALAEGFECSMCGGMLGPAVKRTCTCYDTDFVNLKSLGSVIQGKLNYHVAKNFRFIETSWVNQPADVTAWSDILL